MNPGLSTADIGRFVIDEKSFLGQTLKLGIEFNLLPENAADALRMYLQTHTMIFGQKNRTGIAIGREELEQGVFQAMACLDLGLVDQSDGDANRGAELLATGDFESVRKRGWEIAFFQLEEMQQEARLFPKRRESAFLQDYAAPVRRWTHTAPETWLCTDPEEEDGPTIADPVREYGTYRDLMLKIDLLRSLPGDALKRFGSAAGTRLPFTDLLRNLVLSLSLELEALLPDPAQITAFTGLLTAEGQYAQVESMVTSQLSEQLGSDADEEARGRFLAEVREEMQDMVLISSETLEDTFVRLPC